MEIQPEQIPDIVVDLEKAIKKGGSKFLNSLPGFAVNYLKKILRQDELNEIHRRNKHHIAIDYVRAILNDMSIKVNIRGTENVPIEGRYVYVANHSQGGIDALAYLLAINQIHPNIISPSNELFMYIPNLHPLIIGINVFGKNTKEKARAVNDAFDSDSQIMIFPSGEVSRRIKGEIIDPEWHKTFITKAIESKRSVVPAFITGRNSNKFYILSKIRKFLGIKMYIESLLLPQEMLKQRNHEITITFGKPISYNSFNNSLSHVEWAQKVKEIVYSIKNQSE